MPQSPSDPPRPVSLTKVVWNDYATLLLLLFTLMLWGLGAAAFWGNLPSRSGGPVVLGPGKRAWVMALNAAITLGCGGLMARRIATFYRVVGRGDAVPGKITRVWFSRDRGRIEYFYRHQDVSYRSWNAVMKTRGTRRLRTGDAVTLVVDPRKPTRAYLTKLYTRAAA